MPKAVSEIIGCTVVADDGTCGRVQDILFDDASWLVRYLILRVEAADGDRDFELPFDRICGLDLRRRLVRYSGSRASAHSDNLVDVDPPVCRQERIKQGPVPAPVLVSTSNPDWGSFPVFLPPPPDTPIPDGRDRSSVAGRQETFDSHLRSAKEVIGYRVQALNGRAGWVEDVLIDDVSHLVRFMVVEMRRLWHRTRVLVPVDRICGICWALMRVAVALDKQAVRSLLRSEST